MSALHCPTCNSPQPSRHPATGYEGEVYKICPDQWHDSSELTRNARAFMAAGQRLETDNQPAASKPASDELVLRYEAGYNDGYNDGWAAAAR